MIKILFVCHGNICRSTMAESVFTYLVNTKGVADDFEVYSAGTSREEIGNEPHWGIVDKLAREHIPIVPHKAVQMTVDDGNYYDYLIGMDSANIANMKRIVQGNEEKVVKLLSFTGENGDIADPWYTGNFEKTFDDIWRGSMALLERLLDTKL